MAAVPKSGEFQEGKLWFQRKGSIVTVGLTSLATEEVGQVQSVDLPDEEEDFEKGDVVATVDGTNGKLEVTAPASGFIKEVNAALAEEPDTVSEDPLEEGWLVKIEIQDPSDLQEYAAEEDEEEG
ncbi:MAG: glycine cleavage system protein H [Oligoflexia bacterium]|nr:glycine cleavage system protein H [Oligoflexia bacterium]